MPASDQRVVIETQTAHKAGTVIAALGWGSILFIAGLLGYYMQLTSARPVSLRGVALSSAMLGLGTMALITLWTGKRVIIDRELGEVRVRYTLLGVGLWWHRLRLDGISAVAIGPEIPNDAFDGELLGRRGFTSTEEQYVVALETDGEDLPVSLSNDLPEARAHAASLAHALGVMMIDTTSEQVVHTQPHELAK